MGNNALPRSGAVNALRGGSAQSKRRLATTFAVLAIGLIAVLVPTSSASAAQTRPYVGTSFGPDGVDSSETFESVKSVTVDQTTGDVYVYDTSDGGKVYKFDATGTPEDFMASGSNVIEGVGGAPGARAEYQVAVAPSGAPGGTAGDVYVANNETVKVFESSGIELGTLGEGQTCGVAVDAAGNLFIGTFPGTINEYVARENPPTNADLSAAGVNNQALGICNVAADGEGKIYAANQSGSGPAQGLYKLEGVADENPLKLDLSATTVATEAGSGDVYADRQDLVIVYGPTSTRLGSFGAGQLTSSFGVAIDSATDQVYASDGGSGRVKIFGAPVTVPTVTVETVTVGTPFEASLTGTIDPEGLPVTECFFEYETGGGPVEFAQCEALPPTNSEPHPVSAHIVGLAPNGAAYNVRLVAGNSNGPETSPDQSFETGSTVVTEPPHPVGETTATLNGLVFPGGQQYTECKFEYGLTTRPGFEEEVECSPTAADIPPGAVSQPVSADISGLQANNADYRFRLVATNGGGTVYGGTLTFSTSGEPRISEVRASFAEETSATLEATVDPRGFDTSYTIEWGPTTSYGNIAATGSIGAEDGPNRVNARITGLAPGTSYHYRVVAANAKGTPTSLDLEIETLNSCGLPENRCFELVSPRDVGPVAKPGGPAGELSLRYQSGAQPGTLAYLVEAGLPNATTGADVLYRSDRGAEGWSYAQVDPALTARGETSGPESTSVKMLGFAQDLSCGVLESNQPLTPDAGPRRVIEAGGVNLYRLNPDGSHTAISQLPPENPQAAKGAFNTEYELAGFSQDCGKVVFRSPYHYPGVSGGGLGEQLYEWEEGELRGAGVVPGPSGLVEVSAKPGGGENQLNAVSTDGSTVFFTATSQVGNDSGSEAIFARIDGAEVFDVSQSTLAVDTGATYQGATRDGSRVFFTANAGLTDHASPEGKDLYEYNLENEELVDLSADSDEGGAQVGGFIGASEDGTHVYFIARGQLDVGEGRTLEENVKAKTYSIYGEKDGEISYVGVVDGAESRDLYPVITEKQPRQTARVSADGRYLLFESTANVTGYEPGDGVPEVYLYDADAGSEPTLCVSCRQDGKPSVTPSGNRPLVSGEKYNPLYLPRTLVVKDGQPIVSFTSFDRLAAGAVEGEGNLYEWSGGQVFRLATEPPGIRPPAAEKIGSLGSESEPYVHFADASVDGTDLYLATPASLNWEDSDGRYSVYDARVGGGFPEPSPGAHPCAATIEGSCSGPSVAAPTVPGAASANFAAPGNPKHHKKKHHKKKHHKKKHHKKKHHKKKHHKKLNAGADRRAGK